jgi:hypothetical protein
VVREVAAGRLRVEPFAHIALGAAGAPGHFFRAQRAGARQGLVQAELRTQADHHAGVAGGEVTYGSRHEGVELG